MYVKLSENGVQRPLNKPFGENIKKQYWYLNEYAFVLSVSFLECFLTALYRSKK